MALLVDMAVIVSLFLAVAFGWNHDGHAKRASALDDGVGVVRFVRDQVFGFDALDELASFRAISAGTVRNNDSDRHTVRIHGQMYLAVEPPFERLMAWLPPRAPAACGCTLQ